MVGQTDSRIQGVEKLISTIARDCLPQLEALSERLGELYRSNDTLQRQVVALTRQKQQLQKIREETSARWSALSTGLETEIQSVLNLPEVKDLILTSDKCIIWLEISSPVEGQPDGALVRGGWQVVLNPQASSKDERVRCYADSVYISELGRVVGGPGIAVDGGVQNSDVANRLGQLAGSLQLLEVTKLVIAEITSEHNCSMVLAAPTGWRGKAIGETDLDAGDFLPDMVRSLVERKQALAELEYQRSVLKNRYYSVLTSADAERLTAEFEKIHNLPVVTDLLVGSESFSVHTRPLSAIAVASGRRHNLGRFEITVFCDGSNGGVRVKNLSQTIQIAGVLFFAPHILSNGRFPQGPAERSFLKLIINGQYAKLIKFATSLLQKVPNDEMSQGILELFP